MDKPNGTEEESLEWWCSSCAKQDPYKAMAKYVRLTQLWQRYPYKPEDIEEAFLRKMELTGKNSGWRRALRGLFDITLPEESRRLMYSP